MRQPTAGEEKRRPGDAAPGRVTVRKAKLADVKAIHRLVNDSTRDSEVLPRSLLEIYESLRDFSIAEAGGRIVACLALHIAWEDLAEIRSLVVSPDWQGRKIGSRLIKAALREAKRLAVPRVFILTAKPAFFEKHGFEHVDKEKLPHKIWSDCLKCPKFPNCDEVALWKKLS